MAVVLFTALVFGCDSPGSDVPGDNSLSVIHDTIQGVPRVRSSGTPPTWSLVKEVEIGSLGSTAEASPDEFGRVSSAVVDSGGRLYVADMLAHEIRVFDREGAFLSRYGREGQGPGEFGNIYSLAWLDGTLLALDFTNGRIAELSPSGEWRGQRRAPGRISGSPANLRLYQVGDAVYAWSLSVGEGELTRKFILHLASGASDTVPMVEPPRDPSSFIICEDPASGVVASFQIPFGPRLLQHPLPGGRLVVSWTESYRLAVLDEAHDTLGVIERRRDPVPVGSDEWRRELAAYEEFRERSPGATCNPSSPGRPRFKAPVTNLLVDTRGRIWVETPTDSASVWEVFTEGGALLAEVPWHPYSDRVAPYITDDWMVLTVRDSLDVDHVQRFAIGRNN